MVGHGTFLFIACGAGSECGGKDILSWERGTSPTAADIAIILEHYRIRLLALHKLFRDLKCETDLACSFNNVQNRLVSRRWGLWGTFTVDVRSMTT